MKKTSFARAALAALALVPVSAVVARSSDAPADTICTVLATADRYVGTTVTVRGVAVVDGKWTTLSDAQCKGVIDLNMSDASTMKRDVLAFRRTVSGKGVRADATVFGRFKVTGDTARPYAIEVYSVRDVNEIAALEGG